MNTQTEKRAAEKLLTAYADALNSANTNLIASFYTRDGVLLPDGLKDLHSGDLLNRSKSFFKNRRFQINYAVPDTVIEGEYAFVQTIAKTTTTNLEKDQVEEKTSRDFFVLRKEKEDWKIFRYLFNSLEK